MRNKMIWACIKTWGQNDYVKWMDAFTIEEAIDELVEIYYHDVDRGTERTPENYRIELWRDLTGRFDYDQDHPLVMIKGEAIL